MYGSVFTLFCYYAMGMPLALYLCFKVNMGIAGLWLGFTIACCVLNAGFFVIIYQPDWQQIADTMREHIEQEELEKKKGAIKKDISASEHTESSLLIH